MATRTSNVGNFNTGDVLTEAHVDSLPAGWLGYVEKTSDTTSITTSPVTILTVTVTLNASRRIKITGYVNLWTSTVSGDRAGFFLMEGGTQLQVGRSTVQLAGLATEPPTVVMAVETPTAGSHTYSVTAARIGGTGTLTVAADTTSASCILVEDMGPA